MSKGNLFLGLASGSVGDVTFYRRNAQQISRVRIRNVKNPQTPAQMGQRAINRTAVGAYKVLKDICDHSFEGFSYGAGCYARFLSLNMGILRTEAAHPDAQIGNKSFLPKNLEGLVAMPFILSSGSLPTVDSHIMEDTQSHVQSAFLMSGSNPSGITYQQVIDALHARQGDQLTIIRVPNPVDDNYPDEPLGRRMDLARIILDPGSGNLPSETEFYDTSGGAIRLNDPNPRNEGSPIFFASSAGIGVSTSVLTDNNFAFALILSRQKEDGTWLRSPSRLMFDPSWRENGYTLTQASTLGPVDVYIENEYYLNNAE